MLIKEIEKIAGLKWLRLLYLYPTGITDKLLETIAASEKVVHYFDIPLQHINNNILKNMRRPDTKEQIYKLIEKIRIILPDAVLRTTLIVGLPGETEKEFDGASGFYQMGRIRLSRLFQILRRSRYRRGANARPGP